jgi:DNA (cytosine-5)-methyltransferase 1
VIVIWIEAKYTAAPARNEVWASSAWSSRRRRATGCPSLPPVGSLGVKTAAPVVSAVDLFCGAGGLSRGLLDAGVKVVAGIDVDPECAYPFEANIEAPFLQRDVAAVRAEHLAPLWVAGAARLLAGCAPCQPFSPYRGGSDTTTDKKWPLLNQFGRLVAEVEPDVVTMENVVRIKNASVFTDFVKALRKLGYEVDWKVCHGPRFGLPQQRRRLVLLASRLGPIKVPDGDVEPQDFRTVRDAIGKLPPIAAGEVHQVDRLHWARTLSPLNLKRIAASKPGGTWRDWPEELRSPCHRKTSGSSFQSVYARMEWDAPSPTITTLAHNFGTGRFGHPEQDRPISLREAALLQGFPPEYVLVRDGDRVKMDALGRLIGNAVPPPLARAVGATVVQHVMVANRKVSDK